MEKDEILTLDVGGKCFKTYKNTLMKYPETVLGKMYSNNRNFKIDAVQFFDRSHKLFTHILDFYRTGILSKPLFVNNEVWLDEVRYWGLPEPEMTLDIEQAFLQIIEMIRDGRLTQPQRQEAHRGPIGPIGPRGPEGPEGPEGPTGPRGPTVVR